MILVMISSHVTDQHHMNLCTSKQFYLPAGLQVQYSESSFQCVSFHMPQLLKELHNPKVTDKTFISDATKSSTSCQGHEFLFTPLLPSRILSHHQHIKLGSGFRSSASLWHSWKKCFHNNHFSIVWNSFVTILQQLQAVIIAPIMKYPLQTNVSEDKQNSFIYLVTILKLKQENQKFNA